MIKIKYFSNLKTLLLRNFTNKRRNRTNLLVTLVVPPFLGILLSFVLRRTNDGQEYLYADNGNIPIYIFVSIIVMIFLGLTNSVDDIIKDKTILVRERLLGIRVSAYLLSKYIVLLFFAIIQVLLYLLVSQNILGINSLFSEYFIYLLLANNLGISFGLLISSVSKSANIALNIMPLTLIPQIVFGGALIQYEKMNKDLRINPASVIPEFCNLMPSRWAFEGLFVASSNPGGLQELVVKQEELQVAYLVCKEKCLEKDPDANCAENQCKDLYESREEVQAALADRSVLLNNEIRTAVLNADTEQLNDQSKQVHFLAPYKLVSGHKISTQLFNKIVLLCFITFNFVLTYAALRSKKLPR